MLKQILFLALFAGMSFTFAQEVKKNMELVGHLAYSNERLSDVWAYVDPNGHEYALVGAENGFSIVDLGDPANPVELQYIPGANTIWRDAIVYEEYAYVSNEGGNGVLIINLSTLPNQVVFKDTALGGINTAHNIWMDDGFLYVVGSDVGVGGMEIFDLRTDPWHPAYVGSYNTHYVHDVYIRNNIAYSAEINDGLLTILDVTDKTNIQTLGARIYVNAQTHNTWLNDNSDICFTTDEIGAGYIIAWDVSDPTDIRELDRIRSSLSGGQATPHNAHVLNDYIITSYYADGVHIIDANRPNNLVEVGYYDTSPSEGPGFVGCWGAYPFLPSGLVLGADISEGLFILRPTYVRACYLEGNVTDASNGNALVNVQVEILTTPSGELTENSGDYSLGVPEAGTYGVTFSKYGYEPASAQVTLTNGMVTVQDIQMTPSTPVNLEINVVDEDSGLPIEGANVAALTFGFSQEFVADASGAVSEPGFLTGQYSFVAGKWGYVTKGVDFQVSQAGTSVTIELARGYYDDYIFDFSWIVDAGSLQGNWEWGVPKPTQIFGFPLNPGEDVDNDYGDKAYVTGNTGNNPVDDDVGPGRTNLISPAMDLSTFVEPIMDFSYWMIDANPGNGAPGNDTLWVELIDGANLHRIATISDPFAAFWNDTSINLSVFGPLGSNARVRFGTEEIAPDGILEVGIDRFQIREGSNVAIDPGLEDKVSLKVFPNPAPDQVFVQYDLSQAGLVQGYTFDVLDLHGRTVRSNRLDAVQGTVTVDFDLPAGLYLGVLKLQGEPVKTIKIVK